MMLKVAPAAPAVRALFCARRGHRRNRRRLQGRGKMRTPISFEHFDARLDPATLAAVDEWRAGQCDLPARNDAIRRLIEAGLDSPRRIRLSDGEKLIVRMLGELLNGLK